MGTSPLSWAILKVVAASINILGSVVLLATPATAATQIYKFTADCSDCTDVLGTLTLQDYNPDTALSLRNFVSLDYSSSVFPSLSFAQSDALYLSGQLPLSGPAYFLFTGSYGPYAEWSLTTHNAGDWEIRIFSAGSVEDYGPSHNFELVSNSSVSGPSSAVPEPATWAMMIAGFGAVGWAMRERRRQSCCAWRALTYSSREL